MTLKKLFGKNVKRIRENKGLTQQELAELCDMQPNSIALIETGQRGATFPTVEILAKNLNVEYSELFTLNDEINQSKEKLIMNLNKKVSSFDTKLLKHMISYAESIKELFNKKN